ncbi:MAG: hypothetical protein LBF42_03100, partial [Puniceicoccales bacterium]|nr:hypothetical protein [Puniceicoccales bacterium]
MSTKKVTSDRINVATDTASSVPNSRIRSEAIFTKFLNENLKIKIEPSLLEQRQSLSVPDSDPTASEAASSAANAKDDNGISAQMQEVVEE